MNKHAALFCLILLAGAAWIATAENGSVPAGWTQVAPGVFRSPGWPAGYALVSGSEALLIDTPCDSAGLPGVSKVSAVYLTSYHRDACAQVGRILKRQIPVFAPKGAKDWLTTEGVKKYWQTSLPLRDSHTAYLVVPAGFDGILFTLSNTQKITWHDWQIEVVDTPGHARAGISLIAHKGNGPRLAFTGGAFASPGKLWAPYTTDWDHWTDAGLKPAGKSLRTLADLAPEILCPAHGAVVRQGVVAALTRSAESVEEAGFLKSFERYTKQRLGNAPNYRFLAKEQAESNGSKPWSRVSEHLYLTGNTYVLVSKENACLMIDPWEKRSADQFVKLQSDQHLGPLEVVTFSHAHFDHYDGVYHLPDRSKFEVWTLDQVAAPLAHPYSLRAPFLDARPIHFDRTPRDGDTLTWREYRFLFHHFPGQTEFTMGVETVIDGKRCFFTADNFFHQDMFSGSGGWMGLNRSFPTMYAASAQRVLDAAPDWVLAEHGGPFEFNAEDFRRRVRWGNEAGRAADALSPSGNHRHDWNPHHVHIEPVVQKSRVGGEVQATLVITNVLPRPAHMTVELEGRGLTANQKWTLDVGAGATVRRSVQFTLAAATSAGRNVFACSVYDGARRDGSDTFIAVDVALSK